jgi:hypothetical protein
MLVVLPIGFPVGALAIDLAFWGTSDPFWARASEWPLSGAIVKGALAAVAGLAEFVAISPDRSSVAGWLYFLGILLSLWNLLDRMGGELVFRHRTGMIEDESEVLRSAAGAPAMGIDLGHAGGRRTPA